MPEKVITLYALADDQSNKALATSECFDLMGVSVKDSGSHPYTLMFCGGSALFHRRRAIGFSVEGIDGVSCIELPTVMECSEIPNIHDEIPTPEIVRYHRHLKDVTIPAFGPKFKDSSFDWQ